MVTEGYRRGRPCHRPTHPQTTPGPTDGRTYIIYGAFCLRCYKNIVFYGVSGPSAAKKNILAMLKNIGFYVVLVQEGARNGKKWHLKIVST